MLRSGSYGQLFMSSSVTLRTHARLDLRPRPGVNLSGQCSALRAALGRGRPSQELEGT
jgi:hypothetical protein